MSAPGLNNHGQNNVRQVNADWRDEIHKVVDGLCDTVERTGPFFGAILLQINYQGKITHLDTNIKTTIKR
jgi:hypothetical protein